MQCLFIQLSVVSACRSHAPIVGNNVANCFDSASGSCVRNELDAVVRADGGANQDKVQVCAANRVSRPLLFARE